MKFLLLLLLLVSTPSLAAKLLVNTPTGDQEVLTVGAGGGYFDPARVLWDDRTDGPLVVDPSKLGGYFRAGNALEVDQAAAATYQARKAAEAAAAAAKETAAAARRARMRARGLYKALSAAEKLDALEDALEELKER